MAHRFVGLRQWGMNPSDDKPCQVCGVLKGSHDNKDLCRAVANLQGGHITCDLQYPHEPLGHSNKEHQLLWWGHVEATISTDTRVRANA